MLYVLMSSKVMKFGKITTKTFLLDISLYYYLADVEKRKTIKCLKIRFQKNKTKVSTISYQTNVQ